VDVSYLDTTVSLLAATPMLRDFFFNGSSCGRGEGALGGSFPYYTTYETADANSYQWAVLNHGYGRISAQQLGVRI